MLPSVPSDSSVVHDRWLGHTTCFCVVAVSLLLSGCAVLRPLPPPKSSAAATGGESTSAYDQALKTAMQVIEGYHGRVNGASRLLLAHHFLEALVGGTAVGTLVKESESPAGGLSFKNLGALAALVGVVFQVVTDEADLRGQREGYTRGISVLECAVAVTSQTNTPQGGWRIKTTLSPAEDRLRADVLLGAVHAVHSSVAASVTSTGLGDTRAPPGKSELGTADKKCPPRILAHSDEPVPESAHSGHTAKPLSDTVECALGSGQVQTAILKVAQRRLQSTGVVSVDEPREVIADVNSVGAGRRCTDGRRGCC